MNRSVVRSRAKREQLKWVQGLSPENQGTNIVLTVLRVDCLTTNIVLTVLCNTAKHKVLTVLCEFARQRSGGFSDRETRRGSGQGPGAPTAA